MSHTTAVITTAVITTAAERLTEAGYHVTTRHVHRRGSDTTEPLVWARNGSKLATTFCDGVDLKSAAGIVKRASRFLGEPKVAE